MKLNSQSTTFLSRARTAGCAGGVSARLEEKKARGPNSRGKRKPSGHKTFIRRIVHSDLRDDHKYKFAGGERKKGLRKNKKIERDRKVGHKLIRTRVF